MTDLDNSYATKGTITITLASLGDGSSRESTAWDWGGASGNIVEMFLQLQLNGQSGGTGLVYVYAYASLRDSGSSPIYSDGASGSDAAFTTANILNSPLVQAVQMNAATGVKPKPVALSQFFGGWLPSAGGIIVRNESGAALSATGGDFICEYRGASLAGA